LQPYIVLSERLGGFLAQAAVGSLQEVSLRYSGRMAEWKTDLLRNAAIKGLLSRSLSERANLVNAASLAEELGLRVHEAKKSKAPGGGAGNVLSILVKTDQQEVLVKGAVLHGNSPRLLGVDDIDIEAPLERNVIYLRNRDVPGVVGRVGTILGAHQVNIANFALGREERKSDERNAIAVIQVDSPVPEAALEELRALKAITFAKAMRF